jgi:hypothetical protein
MVKYVGDSYVFPEDFAVVSFDGLTEVDYENVEVYFDNAELYNLTDSAAAVQDDVDILVIEAKNTDSITIGNEETDKIAIFWAANASSTMGTDTATGALEYFYNDHDGDYTPSGKWRFADSDNASTSAITRTSAIATIEVEDTIIDIDVALDGGYVSVFFEDPNDDDIVLNVTGSTAPAVGAGVLDQFGDTSEDADAQDVVVDSVDVSTKDADIMQYYGIVVKDVENNADSDEFLMEVPSEQVYAIVSVLGTEGSVSSSASALGDVVIKDSEAGSVNKNLIVVGGSCINSVAADLLGAGCGDVFTTNTGVGAGEYLIQSFDHDGKVALVVAGYEAADTVAAVTALTTQTVDTSAGMKYTGGVGTSLTAA